MYYYNDEPLTDSFHQLWRFVDLKSLLLESGIKSDHFKVTYINLQNKIVFLDEFEFFDSTLLLIQLSGIILYLHYYIYNQ